MDDCLVVRLPTMFICGTCNPHARIVSDTAHVGLEPLLDDHGELVGLCSVARHPGCGHRMPQVQMYEEDVAEVMELGTGDVLRAVLLEDEDEDGED